MPPRKPSFSRNKACGLCLSLTYYLLIFLFTLTGCINSKTNFKLWHVVHRVWNLCMILMRALILTVAKCQRREATLGLERTSQTAFKCRPRALCWWWWWLIPPMVGNCELWLFNRTAQHQELHSSLQPWQCWETVEMRCNRQESKPL